MLLFLSPVVWSLALTAGLAAAMLALQRVGRAIGKRRAEADPEKHAAGLGTVEGPLYGLFGLLLAFTFAGATSRFQDRRAMILDEAKAVSTAWETLELLPPAVRDDCRKQLCAYVEQHLAAFAETHDDAAFRADYQQLERLGDAIWRTAAAQCRTEESRNFTSVVMPSLTAVFDIATARRATLNTHPPLAIYVLLFLFAMACALLAGYAASPSKTPSAVHRWLLALAIPATIYVTLDLEFPRLGLLRVDAADALLREVRESMK